MRWVVAYDIRDDRRRKKVEKILRADGFRVQYSVFECDLGGQRLDRLKAKLSGVIEDEDSVRFYALCQACESRGIVLPQGQRCVWDSIVVA